MDEQRLIELEIKITHQEGTLEALNETLLEQQREIARLQETLARFIRRFDELTQGGLDIGPANEKPPHY